MSATGNPAQLAGQATSTDPETGLRAVRALRQLLDDLERLQVDHARDQGWSWAQIAQILQVSKQSVHEKHARRRRTEGKED